jgi:hypothetical protein
MLNSLRARAPLPRHFRQPHPIPFHSLHITRSVLSHASSFNPLPVSPDLLHQLTLVPVQLSLLIEDHPPRLTRIFSRRLKACLLELLIASRIRLALRSHHAVYVSNMRRDFANARLYWCCCSSDLDRALAVPNADMSSVGLNSGVDVGFASFGMRDVGVVGVA